MLTTVGVNHATHRQIDKLCKRYNLKKGEIVKLAFTYLDKAGINPAEAPESVKSELAKISKRQDDVIRFIRHFEAEQLNPTIRATHAIAARFDGVVKALETLVLSQLEENQKKHSLVLQKVADILQQQAEAISHQGAQIGALQQAQKKDGAKLLKLLSLYTNLTSCGVMDGKRKEKLKAEIENLINEQQA